MCKTLDILHETICVVWLRTLLLVISDMLDVGLLSYFQFNNCFNHQANGKLTDSPVSGLTVEANLLCRYLIEFRAIHVGYTSVIVNGAQGSSFCHILNATLLKGCTNR